LFISAPFRLFLVYRMFLSLSKKAQGQRLFLLYIFIDAELNSA